jgi:hypothetical protein
LLKNGAFTDAELDAIDAYNAPRGFQVVYSPRMQNADNLYAQLVRAEDRHRFAAAASFNLLPVTDDRPFFNRLRKNWGDSYRNDPLVPPDVSEVLNRQPRRMPIPMDDIGLWAIGIEAAVLSLLFILLPLATFHRSGLRSTATGPFLVYFGALGLGFILIELCLMQKFVLFLGYPVYAIAIVLCSLLVSAGIGSALTARFRRPPAEIIPWITAAICLVVVADLFFLPAAFRAFLGQSLPVRGMVAFLLLFPTGLLLGMPFPLGIRTVEAECARLIPWLWGVNGYMTVVGSVLSMVIAIHFGFATTLLAAAAIYAVGGTAVAIYRARTMRVPVSARPVASRRPSAVAK